MPNRVCENPGASARGPGHPRFETEIRGLLAAEFDHTGRPDDPDKPVVSMGGAG